MTPSDIRNQLITAGVLREGHAPTKKKTCYKCGAEFETLMHDHTRMCGNCQHYKHKPNHRRHK